MLTKFVFALALLATTLSGSAVAQDCDKEESAIFIAQCYLDRYDAADKALNVVYNTAMKSLKGESKEKFLDAQRAWLKYRDASFAFVIAANKDARSYGNIVIAKYKATLVEKRVQEMKFMLAGPADAPVVW